MSLLPKYMVLFVLLATAGMVHAQKATGKITGVVISDSSRQQVPNATIALFNKKDSTVEKMVTADSKGRFILSNLKPAAYQLTISDVGHETLFKDLTVTASADEIDLDTLVIMVRSYKMDMITVIQQKPPVVIKTDTIEFNASSFKVRDNALVEDLLKKLPGVEVSRNGTVTAQGEQVTKVYVDGKPFFGNDPKTATQNLPANIIDKVQVIDERSEQSKVTKVDDGQTQKVINITIKKDKSRGTFGRGYLGYGTDDHYEGRVSANYFDKVRKLALIAGGNNTGRVDNGNGSNDENTSYNTNNGITTDFQSRVNFTDEFGKKLNASANLAYNTNTTKLDQHRQRQSILADSINYYTDESISTRKRSGINGGIYLEYHPDTLLRVMVNESGNFYRYNTENSSIFNTELASKRKINKGDRINTNSTSTPSISGNITASRALKKRGRSFFLNLNNNINNNISDGFSQSSNYFYPLTEPDYERILNQFLNNDNRSTFISSSLSYSEPIGKKGSLNLNVSYNFNQNNTIREAFDFNPLTNLYDLLNDSLTNRFDNFSDNRSVGFNYNYAFKKANISVGTAWQSTYTSSKSILNDSVFSQRYSGFNPYANFNSSGKGKRITINYNYSKRAPQPFQLQRIIDNTNPLYLRLGNPGLTYSSVHRINFNLNLYKQKSGFNINSNGNFNAILNNISNSTVFDKSSGVQTTMPVNVDGAYNGYARLYANQPLKLFKNRNGLYASVSYNINRLVSLLDYQKNTSIYTGINFGGGTTVEVKEFADISVGYRYNIQQNTYSLKEQQNYKSTSEIIETSLKITPNKTTELKIDWDHTANRGQSAGFNRTINMVDVDLTQYLGKTKAWWLKLKVYDLLKQNTNIYRFSGENYVEDVQTNIITRFFLLSLNLRLNKFQGAKK